MAERGCLAVLLLLAAAVCAAPASAASAIASLDVTAPRAFGWRIGDMFERRIVLRLHAPYRLVADSLPPAGRHTPWLALERPVIEEDRESAGRRYDVRLRYQLVSISPDFPDIALPEVLLRMSDGKETQQALIPASRLRVAPITDFTGHDLRPAQAPAALPRTGWRVALWSSLLGLALVGLAWLRWGDAFATQARPFARLGRQLAGQGDGAWAGDGYADALRAVHQAFNATAGRTLFGESLDAFFAERPRYAPRRAEIGEFFRRSTAYFYGGAADAAIYSRAELAGFVRDCADLERGLG